MGSSDRRTPDAPAGGRSHYQVLGVRPGASRDEIRRAHRQLAHLLHPDRLAGASAAERSLAERRMREVNAAWTVLGDPDRRREYDRSLERTMDSGPGRSGGTTGATSGRGRHRAVDEFDDPDEAYARARMADVDPGEPDLLPLQYWLLRRAPILAALGVAALLFVLTAYAGRGSGGDLSGSTGSVPAVVDANGRCIDADLAVRVACSGPNDGEIVNTVDRAETCDPALQAVALHDRIACVKVEP